MVDFIIRLVPNYGYLPIIEKDGVEVFRGSFKKTSAAALETCEEHVKDI